LAAQIALDRLMADCAVDPACRAEFGDMRANLTMALQRVVASTISPQVFLEKLRTKLYSPAGRVQVPYLLAQAAQGDFARFTVASLNPRVFADGLYLSITCTESLAQMDLEGAIAAARATTFGAYRLESQRAACAEWPRGVMDPHLMRQPASSIPVLFIAGEQDPVTPADWAQEVAANFSNGLVVRVPNGAHVMDGLTGLDTCLDAVTIRFFDAGTTRALDTSCFSKMMPPAFGGPPFGAPP
jgi:pimeloyl-ACP methyl ester carboxylesterase